MAQNEQVRGNQGQSQQKGVLNPGNEQDEELQLGQEGEDQDQTDVDEDDDEDGVDITTKDPTRIQNTEVDDRDSVE